MAISSTIKTIIPYIKEAGNYVKMMISSQAVKMNDGKDLETTITELNNKLVGFPHYGSVLGTYVNQSFTVSKNCWAKVQITSGWDNATLSVNGNGVLFQQIQNTSSYPIKVTTLIPLMQGDRVTMSSSTSTNSITVTLYNMR